MSTPSPRTYKHLTILTLAFFMLSAFAISGFTIDPVDSRTEVPLPPSEGPEAQGVNLPNTGGGQDDGSSDGGASSDETDSVEPINVIKNGDFELPFEEDSGGVAPDWDPFGNGRGHIEWYEELWPEAVLQGERAQLMEIFQVEPNVLDRVVAIHQTVDVRPNSTYDLTLHAIMRTQVQPADRNNNEFEMHWGVDFSGTGDYKNVEEWVLMPLEEQFRLGSTGEYPDDLPLFYETITGTVSTGDSSRITLFIRGLKKFPTGAEVNFDVDNVSLVGPPPGPIVVITPEVPADTTADDSSSTPTEEDNNLPATGVILQGDFSEGAVILGGLMLVILGVGAATSVLQNRKES